MMRIGFLRGPIRAVIMGELRKGFVSQVVVRGVEGTREFRVDILGG